MGTHVSVERKELEAEAQIPIQEAIDYLLKLQKLGVEYIELEANTAERYETNTISSYKK